MEKGGNSCTVCSHPSFPSQPRARCAGHSTEPTRAQPRCQSFPSAAKITFDFIVYINRSALKIPCVARALFTSQQQLSGSISSQLQNSDVFKKNPRNKRTSSLKPQSSISATFLTTAKCCSYRLNDSYELAFTEKAFAFSVVTSPNTWSLFQTCTSELYGTSGGLCMKMEV